MKIAYCVGALNLGGIATVAHNLNQYFLAKGEEFHIITTHHKGGFYSTAEELSWPVKDFSGGERFLPKRIKRLYDCLLHYDVVINNHSDELLFILPALPNHIVKISVQHNTTVKASKRLSFNAEYLHFSAGVSPAVTNIMQSYHKDKKKIKVLPNGVSKAGNKTYNSIQPNPLRLLFVGRLDNLSKNIFIIPKVLEGLTNEGIFSKVSIVGSGEDMHQLKMKFTDLDLDEHVDFIGRVSATRLGDLFNSHDYVLNLSNWEGLPMVVLEAMSAGIIPILSNIEPHQYALGTEISELILPVDNCVNNYVSIIKDLYENPDKNILISKKLVDRWEKKFSIKAFGDNYLKLIKNAKSNEIKSIPIKLNKIKLPFKDKHKATLVYNIAQRILRKS